MVGFNLGDVTVTGITDLPDFQIPLATLFPASDPGQLSGEMDWLSPDFLVNDNVRLPVRSWLLQLDDRNILVDACVGDHKQRPHRADWHERSGGEWLSVLEKCGLRPEDIDAVFCTHMHADHVGWNTRLLDGRWVPTFPNARYISSRTEFEHWQAAAEGAQATPGCFEDSVLPVMNAGQMDLVDEGWELAKGLVLHSSAGHTPGHMSLEVSRGGQRGIFCGDAIHSPIQILIPDWSSAFCTNPDQARVTRLSLLGSLAESHDLLIPMHFGGTAKCRVKRSGNSFRPEFE